MLCFLILSILGCTYSLENAKESKHEVKHSMTYSEIENIVNSVLSHEMINYDFKQETISLRKELRTATTSLRPMLVQLAEQKVIIDGFKNGIEAMKLNYDTVINEISSLVNAMDEDQTFEHDPNNGTKDRRDSVAIDQSEPLDESENTTTIDNNHQSDLNVAFSSYLSSPKPRIYHMSNETILRFDGIILNDRDGYNSETGTFTAPVSGTYLFSFSFSSYPGWGVVNLIINGNIKLIGAVAESSGRYLRDENYHMMGQNTAVVRLQEGDTVWIQTDIMEYNAIYSNVSCCRYTTFSGVLIY